MYLLYGSLALLLLCSVSNDWKLTNPNRVSTSHASPSFRAISGCLRLSWTQSTQPIPYAALPVPHSIFFFFFVFPLRHLMATFQPEMLTIHSFSAHCSDIASSCKLRGLRHPHLPHLLACLAASRPHRREMLSNISISR